MKPGLPSLPGASVYVDFACASLTLRGPSLARRRLSSRAGGLKNGAPARGLYVEVRDASAWESDRFPLREIRFAGNEGGLFRKSRSRALEKDKYYAPSVRGPRLWIIKSATFDVSYCLPRPFRSAFVYLYSPRAL